MIKTTFYKALVCVAAWCAGAKAFAATPVAMWDGANLVDGATYVGSGGVTYTLRANGNTALAGGGIQITGTKGVSVTPSSGNVGNQASTVIIRYTGYDTSSLSTSDAQALIVNHTSDASYKDFLGAAATAGGNVWGVWQNTTWGNNKTTSGLYGSTTSQTRQFALAWDQSATVQQGTWFWMDGRNKQGWSSLRGALQTDSIWVGGPNESTTVMPATGMKVLSIAVFDSRLPDAEITAFKFPSEGGPSVYGAIWGNMGTSKSDPGSCSGTPINGGSYNAFTFNFERADGMSQTAVKGYGKAWIRKMRFVRRNGKTTSAPPVLHLVQGELDVASASSATVEGQAFYWADGTEKSGVMYEYAFTSNVTFDVTKDIALKFKDAAGKSKSAEFYTVHPANSVLVKSGWSPVVEVTADWAPARVVNYSVAQCWDGVKTGLLTGEKYDTMLGSVPLAAWSQPVEGAADTTADTDKRGARLEISKYWDGVSARTFADAPGFVIANRLPGGNNLLGYPDHYLTPAFTDFRSAVNQAQNRNGADDTITLSNIPFEKYDAIVYFAGNGGAMNAVRVNDGNYYKPNSAAPGDNAVSATSSTWGDSDEMTLAYGTNAMRIKDLHGSTLKLAQNCAAYGMAAVQLVEVEPLSYTADVVADTSFDDIVWTPAKPAGGFEPGDKLVIKTTGTPTITFESAVSSQAKLTIDGTVKIAAGDGLYEDGCFETAFASFAKLTADAVTFAAVKAGFTGAYAQTATGFTLRAQNKEVISVNFAGGHSVAGTSYTGLAPVQGDTWNNLTDTWSSRTTKTLVPIMATADGTTAAESPGVALEATANNTYQWNGATDVFLKGYLDDGGQASVTVSGVPYTSYDVIVYAATDTDGQSFRAVTVNGSGYTYDSANPTVAKQGTANWGASRGLVAEYGRNAIRIRNQTASTLTIVGGTNGDGARGCIAAIQIVCTGSVIKGTDFFAEATSGGDVSKLAWTPGPLESGRLNTATVAEGAGVTDPISLDFDTAYALFRFGVANAAGQSVTLTANGAVPAIGAYDFSAATGRVEMAFSTGASGVTAGADTVLPAGGTGKLAFGERAMATVMDGLWSGTIDWKADAALRLKGAAMASVPYVTATAGKVVYALPFADQTSADGVQFAGTLNRDFETGFALTTTRFVLGNNDGSIQNFVQKGGALVVTGSTGPGSNQASVLLGHYGSQTRVAVTYDLLGGTFMATNAAIQLGWDGECFLTVGEGGTLRTKGIELGRSGAYNKPASLTVNGVLELGDYGVRSGDANATFAMDGGTIRAYGNATVSVAHANGLAIAGAATFEAAEGKTLILAGDNVQAGAAITVGGAGTVVFRNWRGAVALEGTAMVGYVVNVNDVGVFAVPAGVDPSRVALYDAGFNPITTTVAGQTLVFDWQYTGKSCWWDYEFNGNLASTGTDTTTMTAEGGGPYYNTASNALWVGHATPYRGANYPAEFTAVMRGRIVGVSKQIEIGFGSTADGSAISVALACGNPANKEVLLLISQGYNVVKTVSMTVPNAYTGDHLYAFSCKTANVEGIDKTQLTVYLDGNRLQVYTFDGVVTLGTGFQVGSTHGNPPTGYAKATTAAANDNAFLDFLRTYPVAITDEAMARYAREYPYVSPNGVAERTFGGAANWTATDAWRVEPYEAAPYVTNKPPALANVVISATAPSEVAFDLTAAANYESFTATNGAAIALRKGGTAKPSVKGFMTVGIPLTLDYDAMSLAATPLVVQDGKTMAFDFRALDVSGVWATTTNVLTGIVTLRDASQVVGVNLPKSAGRTVTFALNESTHRCELRITVDDEPFVCTVAEDGTKTWTWAGQPTTEAIADAHTAFPIWKEGPGTLEKSIVVRRYAVNEGTLKATGMAGATVTVNALGIFDVNGKNHATQGCTVTLNGGRLVNNGASLSAGKTQYASISLTDDSAIGGSGNLAYVSYGYANNVLKLGGHTLYKVDGNAFSLANTTVTNGTVVVSNGTLKVESNNGGAKRVVFVEADLVLHGTLDVASGQTLSIGSIAATNGAAISNAGAISAFSLKGEVALKGAGTYGTITLEEAAVLNIGQKHGLAIGGTGTVNAELTQAEVDSGNAIVLFTSTPPDANVKVGTVMYEGQDITDRCTVEGGTITSIDCEAKIGAKKYVTLADAIKAAQKGATITLLRDVALPATVDGSFTLDVNGHELAVAGSHVIGDVMLADGVGTGGVTLDGVLSVVEGGRLALGLARVGGPGRILVGRGTLASAGETAMDGDIEIQADGTLDLSAGKSLACRDFRSSGGCTGGAATLVAAGTLDAHYPTSLTRLRMADNARLLGRGLAVSDAVSFGSCLYVDTDGTGTDKVATVPAGTALGDTRVTYNGKLGYRLSCAGTDLLVTWFSNLWTDYADASGVRKEGDTYVVSNAAGFAWIAAQAADGWFAGTVELAQDIDLSCRNWVPVRQFTGTFDGKGHKITGLNNTNVVEKSGEKSRYPAGPTNDWGYTAYGLFASATNATFRNVLVADVAIDNAADSAAALLGVHAGGDLAVAGVTVAGRIAGTGRAVAGLVTVGGRVGAAVGDVVVTGNVSRATIVGEIADGEDGGNVAQVLAGTTWDTTFGAVVATNNVGAGAFEVSVDDGSGAQPWDASAYNWLDLPVCNLAPAVLHTDDAGAFRSFLEANRTGSRPVDPLNRTARMLAGIMSDGIPDVLGGWTDQITVLEPGATLVITNGGKAVELDGWSTVSVDRNVTIDLNGNGIYQVYDCDVFDVAAGATLTITNGTISVGPGCKAFAGDGAVVNPGGSVKVVELSESFEERTVMPVSQATLSPGKMTFAVPLTSGACVYGVETKPSLADDWQVVPGSAKRGNGGTLELEAPAEAPSGFYRVNAVLDIY